MIHEETVADYYLNTRFKVLISDILQFSSFIEKPSIKLELMGLKARDCSSQASQV